jgi:hypothetical protein
MGKLVVVVARILPLCALLLALPALAAAFPVPPPGTEGLEVIVNGTNPVIATYQGYSSSYSNDLYLVVDGNPANDKLLFNNRTSPVGSTVNLGSFPVGTKLLFRLYVRDTGKNYFTGPGSLNPDGKPHARAQVNWKPNETLVSFEDLLNGDFDYNDLSFSFVPTTVGAKPPGWYRNSGAGGKDSILYEDSKLRIVWENSYIYQYPGKDPLYWYAQVVYHNLDKNNSLTISCAGHANASFAKEHIMHGTTYLGYVAAEETVCTHKPDFSRVIDPGGAFYDWAIFHNVPWAGPGEEGEVSLEWEWQGVRSSKWVKPWQTPVSAPHPTVCPPELETSLKTCQSKIPEGKASVQNLIVLVHGCCTDAQDVYEYRQLADTMIGEIMKTHTPAEWEVVVWDWSNITSDCLTWTQVDCPKKAYDAAPDQGSQLKDAITTAINKSSVNAYEYIHLIGHSAGAKLIHEASIKLVADKTLKKNPFIHITFLDAFTWDNNDTISYGVSADYAEQYVDRTTGLSPIAPWTNSCLMSAFNFDITGWRPFSNQNPDEKEKFGHQWPRYWYQKSVTSSGYKYGYPLSFEWGVVTYKDVFGRYFRNRQCHLDVSTTCQTGNSAPMCW